MNHRIARLVEPLLRLLLPGVGRRRGRIAATGEAVQATAAPYADGPTARRSGSRPLRGEDHALVRPYLLAHERREEERKRQVRRRAVKLAVHGIDIGPRVIRGAEVTV
ncbi:hypothetical protein [Streptomyces sp. NPDC002845]